MMPTVGRGKADGEGRSRMEKKEGTGVRVMRAEMRGKEGRRVRR